MVKLSKRFFALVLVLSLLFTFANVAMADSITLKGKIGLLDDYYVLDTGEKKYFLDGDIDEDLLDKTVEITGIIEKDDSGDEVLVIESIQEIEE